MFTKAIHKKLEIEMDATLFKPGNMRVYHLTHICNLPTILQHGLLSKDLVSCSGIPFSDISLATAQKLRAKKVVNGQRLHRYAPTFVTTSNPMMCSLRNRADELAWLVIDCRKLPAQQCITSDRNFAANHVEYGLGLRAELIDWTIINARCWNNHELGSHKRAAEVLVQDRIDPSAIEAIALGSAEYNSVIAAQCSVPVGQHHQAFMRY